jgi:hypothetical protein
MIAACSAPQWQTVEEITIASDYVFKGTFDSPMFRNLRRLREAWLDLALYLAHDTPNPLALELMAFRWSADEAAVASYQDALVPLFESPGHLATLTGVEIGAPIAPTVFERLAATPLGARLRSFGVRMAPRQLPAWLSVMSQTQVLSFRATGPWIPQASRASASDAWDLELRPVWSEGVAHDQTVEALHDVPREAIRSLTVIGWQGFNRELLERQLGWLNVRFAA